MMRYLTVEKLLELHRLLLEQSGNWALFLRRMAM
jgi:hypothetical protein